ncbi:MAG: peptidylprolyl isomerase, partial [Candidatus Sulfotelmatobacter sp.]
MYRVLICALLPWFGAQASLQAQPGTTPSVELRIIVVDSSSQADRVLQRLKKGEDFAELAKEVSIDPTASDGGYMGRVDPSTLRAEFRDVLKGMVAGEMTSVIHTNSGYAILKVIPPSDRAALQSTAPARILSSSATGTI